MSPRSNHIWLNKWINECLMNLCFFFSQGDTIKSPMNPHIYSILFISFLTTLQFARRQFGKPSGFSSTGSRIPRNTEPGSTPASIRTSAWTTWRRTSATPRSTRTWWPEWVYNHSSCLAVNLQQLMLCFWPAESSRRRRTRRVRAELEGYVQSKWDHFKEKWSHLLYCPSAKLRLSPAFSGLLLQDQKENVS